MGSRKLFAMGPVILCVLAVGCGAPRGPGAGQPGGELPGAPATSKRITAAMGDEPPTFNGRINSAASASVEGGTGIEQLLRAGLVAVDNAGGSHPQMAEAVPTTENGLWRVFADGRMETTWKLRSGARWHDGAPLTTEDLVFSIEVVRDPEMAIFRNSPTANALRALDGLEAPDPLTLVARWKEPFIQADMLFSHDMVYPMPKHLLGDAFSQDRGALIQLPYWSEEFVGNGPFRLRDWARGSHLVLAAFDQYALGRPKIDQIEVRFVQDPNTVVANLLAGQIDLTLHSLSLERATLVRDQWKEGRVGTSFNRWTLVFPQLLSPVPAVVGEVQFRRALLHAIDRQALVDTLMGGLVPVAHMYLGPSAAGFREIEPTISRYEHDPRKAATLVGELGYTRGADGLMRDGSNQRLSVEIRASAGRDLAEKVMLSVADSWQRIGVGTERVVIPVQMARDREYLATFPAFEVSENNPNESWRLGRFKTGQVPLPENRFVGSNRIRYASPEYDALSDRYFSTVPLEARIQALGEIMGHMAEHVLLMGLFYGAEATMISNRLTNVTPGGGLAWNAHEWEIR